MPDHPFGENIQFEYTIYIKSIEQAKTGEKKKNLIEAMLSTSSQAKRFSD